MRLGAVLYVYQGEWGLPSIDFECLRALCLVKFARCPLQIVTKIHPLRSGGKLPLLQIGNEKFIGYRQIKQLLDKEGYPIDVHLNETIYKQLSPAYVNWVFSNLHAYYHYFMYGEPNNFDTTRALYAKRTPFPFNFYYPGTYQKEANEVVLAMGGFDFNDKIDKHESEYIISNAKKCVNALSKKLGKQLWFFGDLLSELDAIVYAYLSILLKISLPNNPLQNHIKGCTNLVNFVNRISKDIFKNEAFNSIKSATSSVTNDAMLTPTERSFMESQKKTKILACIGAVVAMGTFAVWRVFYNQFAHPKRYFDAYEYDEDDDMDDNE